MNFEDIIRFWFEETPSELHFKKSEAFDRLITDRFHGIYRQAFAGELAEWREQPEGRLAEIIVLDQFSRNIFRDTPAAFAADPLALILAQTAVAAGADEKIAVSRRAFMYMPFMHSESALIHSRWLYLFQQPGLEHTCTFELKHKRIIDRFGRYPHRNSILGRKSSPEETAFLTQPDSSF